MYVCPGVCVSWCVYRVCVCLHRFRDTPVVKSSSRELCYIILAGICLGYLCTFTLIAKPHVVHCYMQRLGIGLSPAMSYSALVTKVEEGGRTEEGERGEDGGWRGEEIGRASCRGRV